MSAKPSTISLVPLAHTLIPSGWRLVKLTLNGVKCPLVRKFTGTAVPKVATPLKSNSTGVIMTSRSRSPLTQLSRSPGRPVRCRRESAFNH